MPKAHRARIRAARRHLPSLAALASRDEPDARRRLFYRLRSLDPLVFEELILEAFFRLGNPIRRNRRYSGDGGIDGQVYLSGGWAPIQCKRYRSAIDPQHVADFSAVLRRRRALLGLFIHTGRTGDRSRAHAADSAILFVSGDRLCRLLAATRAAGMDKKGQTIR